LLFGFIEQTSLQGRRDFFTMFMLHYVLALIYVGVLMKDKAYGMRRSWKKRNLGKTIILLTLFLISAYALNREIPVFEDSTTWLSVYLLITSLNTLSFHYFERMPAWINRIQYFILGSAIVFYLYLTTYVVAFYPAGGIGLLFFGIGGHIFVPLTLVIASACIIRYHYQQKGISSGWLIGGFVFTILYAAAFVYTWSERIERIEKVANQYVLNTNNDLPVWVKIGQSLPNDWITERILKTDLVYSTQEDKFGEWDFMPQTISWDEVRKHDPFVFLATFSATCHLPAEDRVRILQSISDVRHQTNERLWSGDNLSTSYIISDIDIYPELRLAYTEKYLSVRNNAQRNSWWGNTEEAIYTFQLPEGSVVTSLSLWINGKEEKGILTSKQQATNAYKTIVGVEQRDPSVVHWREGNTITVRVFPCTRDEERKFKIGITTPLAEREGKLVYEKITFRGPNPNGAKETIRVRTPGKPMETLDGFKKDKNEFQISENEYDPDFELSLPAVPIKSNNRFYFQDHVFSVSEQQPVFEKTVFNTIYLDINNSWTSKDLYELKDLVKGKNVFLYGEDGPILLNEENWSLTLERQGWNFSLFPFHEIKDKAHTLVITKGKPLSPHLSDFKESDFTKSISSFFASGEKVYVYSLDGSSSTYINSLREFRAFNFAQGTVEKLGSWLANNTFPHSEENKEQVVLHHANLVISKQKSDEMVESNAPDHLARLFAYNDILRQTGANYFKGEYINESLVNEARTAYVVSPVSSLIVLETKEDYERFGITDSEDSLKNASKQSSGAVPEPHEWMLIGFFILLAVYLTVKMKMGKSI
jgi:XrtN system VIT domain protein